MIEAARKAAVAAARGRPHPTAIVYQRRGYVTGGDTLTGELLSIAGFTNDGGVLAGKTGGFVPLEKLVANHPDYIVVASADPQAVDQGTALLSHPALTTLYPPSRRIVLPQRLTVCGGPSLPAALDRVSREAAARRAKPLISPDHLWLLAIALALDALVGEPDVIWRRLPHPVALIGGLVGFFDRTLNRRWR